MSAETEIIINQWLAIISQPKIIIPLFGGLAVGYLVSLCPYVGNMKRQNDKAFYVYLANAIGSGGLFLWTQSDQPLDAVLSLLILVCSSSVALPWFWFNVWSRRK